MSDFARADHAHAHANVELPIPASGQSKEFDHNTPLKELREWSKPAPGVPIRSMFWTALHERVCRLEDFSEAIRLLHEKGLEDRCVPGCYSCKVEEMLKRMATARALMEEKR